MNGYMTSLHPTNNSFQKLYTSHSTCTWGSLSREQLANLDAKATCMICVLLVTSYESTVCCSLRLTSAHDDETSLSLFIHLPCIHSIQTQPILCKALQFISVCIPASDQALLLALRSSCTVTATLTGYWLQHKLRADLRYLIVFTKQEAEVHPQLTIYGMYPA